MINQSPEQRARDIIDNMLEKAGWRVQSLKELNLHAAAGIAVREYPTDVGPADYLLFVGGQPVGVIEAKREEEGYKLTVVEEQSGEYARAELKWIKDNKQLPFVYESTGILTRFTDYRDPKPRSRPLFHFHRPETLREWLKEANPLRERLQQLPLLSPDNLRACQYQAIINLELSFAVNRPRALIQMATGAGKTFTAITSSYRLLKHGEAKRILFLVDTRNLGEQAEQEFMAYTPVDDNRKFTELYTVQRLKSNQVSANSCVVISTIQRLYSILKGREIAETDEDLNPHEGFKPKEPVDVTYNEQIPIEFFDFIIIDECHRSIYNLWKQVLDYFDAYLIGLTATPDQRTFAFFNENVVSEYSHENAVADGVNVGYEVFTIETDITKQGAAIKAKEFIDKRDRLTRQKRWEQLDEDIVYTAGELDRDVVNPSQIRNVIRTFKDKLLTEIYPRRNEVPKTLIFAKTDSHADDIIQVVREEFGEGNDFCKKVTYQSKEDPKSLLASFRNAYNPRIAVTVDMIATGTDVKPIECLLFMRDVRSKNYFEQMKGRGTRTLPQDDLQKVTPSALTAKTHFVVIDAVGVCKSVKSDSRPMERKPQTSLKDLLYSVMIGSADEDTLSSLGSRLSKLEKVITPQEREKIVELAGGKNINQVIQDLWNPYNPDMVEEKAREIREETTAYLNDEETARQAQKELLKEATSAFNGELVEYIVNVRRKHDQIIDIVNLDTVTFTGWDTEAKENAQALIDDFKTFIETHRNEITALKIFYSQPYRRRELTYLMIKELVEILKTEKPHLAPLHIWQAYQQLEKTRGNSPVNELTALVALVRRVSGLDGVLTAYDFTVNTNFKEWVFRKQEGQLKFNDEQMEWLRMIKDHIAASVSIDIDDLEYAPFDAKGGLGKFYQLFKADTDQLLQELNEALTA